jgi:hypothetical protein
MRFSVVLLLSLGLFAAVLVSNTVPTQGLAPTVVPTGYPIRNANSEPLFTQDDLHEFGGDVARPNGMVWYNGKIYVLCSGDHTIYELLGTTGMTETYIYGVQDAFTIYAEENADGDLDLWVPDYATGKLVRVTKDEVQTVAEGLDGPWGLIPLDMDTFLISVRILGTIETVSRTGERTEILDGLSLPTGLALDRGYLYVANSGDPDRSIEWYEYAAGDERASEGGVLIEGLGGVMNVQMGPDGLLYFAYSENGLGMVGRVDASTCRFNGGCTAEDVERVVETDLPAPLAGVVFSPDGRLFLHERYSPQLYTVTISE